MVSVFGGTDQVVTHLLFFFSIGSVLGTVGLISDRRLDQGEKKNIV